MLHANTNLLIKKPILIISGANGSGKTQLIEALMILLGEKSPRSKKGLKTLINNPEEESLIEIEVNNRRSDGSFVFQQLEPDIVRFLSKDVISFRAKLTIKKITRYIGDPETNTYKEITLRLLQKLFSQIGIRPNNQLTFTLGETVDIFANQSNFKKFNVLIENLGLAELKEEIIGNEKGIKEAVEDTSKLQRKLKEEEHNLDLFRTMIDAIEQRDKYEAQVETLTIERRWIEVFTLEKTLKNQKTENQMIFDKYNKVKDKIDKIDDKIDTLDYEKKAITDSHSEIRNQRIDIEILIRDRLKEKNSQEGTINLLIDQIKEDNDEINSIEMNKSNKTHIKLKIEQKIIEIQTHQKNLKEQYRNKSEEITSLDENSIDKKSKMRNYEIQLRDETIKFKHEIKNRKLNHTILGPIISYIRLSESKKNESWLPAIKQAIGSYLYSFIALDQSSFKQSKNVFDSIWKDRKPSFEVFRLDNKDVKKRILSKELYAFVPDLLEGDPRVMLTLKRIMTTALSVGKDPNILLDAAISNQVDVLTKDCNSFYRRKGSFSRPPRPFNGELGIEVLEELNFKDIIKTRKILEKELFDIKKEETSLIKEIFETRNELKIIDSPDKELSSLKLRLKRSHLRLVDAKEIIHSAKLFIKDKKEILEIKSNEEKNLNENLELLAENRIQYKIEIKIIREELATLNQDYMKAKDLIKEIEANLTEKIQEVATIGPRPDEIRDYHTVDLELKEIQTKLALVKDKSVPREKLEAQEKRVVELRDNLGKRRDHLEHLREDIQKRIDTWRGQIEPFIINLNEKLQELTKNIFARVKLEIDSPDLEQAGLELKAVTKGEFRYDQALSGGEKVLLMECLILALHALTTSPLHVIDEFTQRLDVKNKTKIFKIVKDLLVQTVDTQFILITPDTLGIEIDEDVQHVVISQAQIKTI